MIKHGSSCDLLQTFNEKKSVLNVRKTTGGYPNNPQLFRIAVYLYFKILYCTAWIQHNGKKCMNPRMMFCAVSPATCSKLSCLGNLILQL